MHIYVVVANEMTKVGIARDVSSRIRSLQTGCPWPIEPYFVTSSLSSSIARRIETRTHGYLRQYRSTGEWFSISPDRAAECVNYLLPVVK